MFRFGMTAALAAALVLGAPAPAAARASQEPATAQEAVFSPEDLRADFADLYRRLQGAHFDLFAFESRAALDQAFEDETAALDRPMTRVQAERRFQLFLARVRMGHTRIQSSEADWTAYRSGGGRAFPLQVRVVDGRLYVARNGSGVDDIRPGDEILEIDGQAAAAWIARTGRHVSAETPYMTGALLEFSFPRLVWLEVGPRDAFDLVLARDGERLTVRTPARTRPEAAGFLASQPAGLDLSEPLREAKMLGDGLAYLRPGPFYNAEAQVEADMFDERAFVAFIDAAFQDFLARDAKILLIDLRNNPGGDNSFSDPMLAWFADRPFRFFSEFKVKVSPEATAANQARLDHDPASAAGVSGQYARLYGAASPGDIVDLDLAFAQPRAGRRFEGPVYLLIDRHSYSNTVSVAAIVQDYGLGVVMGEPTSDMATTYGAMETFNLQRTGIVVGFPKAHIVRPNGDRRSHGVDPDIVLPSPLTQTSADEVLQAALAAVRARETALAGR
jgi:hypothetical protein